MVRFARISTILIWSAHWEALAGWYQDIFRLKVIEEINHPQDTGRLLAFPQGGSWLWIGQHSEVKGQSKDPCRIMFNINVPSIADAYEYLVAKQVKIIAKPFKAPTFDSWFVTLADPDGNLVQLIGPEK